MIQKVSSFLKKDTVLTIALALAVLSMFIIPPSAGYLKYLDLHTLILLFGLMTATTGLQNIGSFRQLGELLLLRIHSLRQLEQLLILLCFFSSMLITNDVAFNYLRSICSGTTADGKPQRPDRSGCRLPDTGSQSRQHDNSGGESPEPVSVFPL